MFCPECGSAGNSENHADQNAADPLDPGKVYSGYLVRPYIGSAGPDHVDGIFYDYDNTPIRYSQTAPPNDPFAYPMAEVMVSEAAVDNLSN